MKKPYLIISKVKYDVIVTSTLACEHSTCAHLYVTEGVREETDYLSRKFYFFKGLEYGAGSTDNPTSRDDYFQFYFNNTNEIKVNTWYYKDENDKYKECNGDHSDYTGIDN